MTVTVPTPVHARLARELAQRNDELEALDSIGKLAASAAGLGDFLGGALRTVEERTRCAGVGVYAHDAPSHSIHLLHQRGLPAELAEKVAHAPVEPPAVFTRPPAEADVVSPAAYSQRFRPFLEQLGITALVRVPLVVGTQIVGVLAVSFAGPTPEEAEPHLRFLRPVGALIGAVIHSDRLLGSLRRRVSELTQLNEENSGLYARLEEAQAQLVLREKLAALGGLSAAVAHEVRNPLGVIFNAVGMLRRRGEMGEEGRALLDIVGEEAERLNRIVTDLLGFARPPAPSLRPAALGPIVEAAVTAALAGRREPVEVSWELAPELPAVALDPGLVRQALINLVQNALHAMGRGGRLRIRTAAAGGAATVEVIDSGPGVPEALRERIFEPFFTTRASGTGLGLAIVKHVVELHGAAIEVGPGPDGGARFTVRFPVAPAAGGPASPAAG